MGVPCPIISQARGPSTSSTSAAMRPGCGCGILSMRPSYTTLFCWIAFTIPSLNQAFRPEEEQRMAAQKTKVVLGTATPGGGFPAYGWPYAEALNAADATLDIEPINT